MAEHFTGETTDFLWGLALNNERGWFDAHRAEYEEYLKKPMSAIARRVFELMDEKYPKENFKLHVSRIWRDARRLHGRGPFKEHLWFSLKGSSGLLEGPMFWFEIGARDYSYGMGYYDAPAFLMEEYRKRVDADPKPLEKLARAYKKQDVFTLDGEQYKRMKKDVGALLNPWYNTKYIALGHHAFPGEALYVPDMAERLVAGYEWLMPYYKYLTALHDSLPKRGDGE